MAEELNRNKFWISISRSSRFSEKDKHIFKVFPCDEEKNYSIDGMPKYIDAKSLEDARRKIHAFIDQQFDYGFCPVDFKNSGEKPKSSDGVKMDSLKISDNARYSC